jgi:hypothetical protein
MASGREYSSTQRKIINRYYDHIDTIILTRLGEIATELVLAGDDQKKLDRLWVRAEKALEKTKSKDPNLDRMIEQVLGSRDIKALGELITKLSR